MYSIGIDVTEHGARAVLVHDDHKVARSITVDEGAPASAAVRAARTLSEGQAVKVIGVAADHHDLAQADAAVKQLSAAHACRAGAAAVAAEVWTGAAQGARDAVCLWIGERVLAGILIDGVPRHGAHGFAGAAAWLAVNPAERQDYRRFGSLAAEVSNRGIARRLAWRIQAGDQSDVLDRAGDLEHITAAHVFDGARAGDGVAISVVRDSARFIAMAIANFATTLDPEVAVLAGPIAAAGDLVLEAVRQECTRWLPPGLAERFRCELSPLGEDGIAIGAARLAAAQA